MSDTIRNPIIDVSGRPDNQGEHTIVHYGVECDGPGWEESEDFIRGIRYKCLECPDVDFCEACLADPSNTHDQHHTVLKCTKEAQFVDTTGLPPEERDEVLGALSRDSRVVRLGATAVNSIYMTPASMGTVPTSVYLDRWLRLDLLWSFLDTTVDWSKTKLEPAGKVPHAKALETPITGGEGGNEQENILVAFRKMLAQDVQWMKIVPEEIHPTPSPSDLKWSRVPGYEVRDYDKTFNGIRILGSKSPPKSGGWIAIHRIGEDGRGTVEYAPVGSGSNEDRQVVVLHDRGEQLSLSRRLREHTFDEDDGFHRFVEERKPAARIMELLPGEGEEKLQCRLISTNVYEGFRYEALSYTLEGEKLDQGERENDRPLEFNSRFDIRYPVYLENSFIKVNMTVRDALRRLRYKDKPRFIWVDQVCVNRRSPREHQIQVMNTPAIFNRAQRVLVWAGEEDEHSAAAIYLCEKLATKCDGPGPMFPSPQDLMEDSDLELPPFGSFQWTALAKFLRKPVFQRIWGIQEVALAQAVTVLYGRHGIPWSSIANVATLLGSAAWIGQCLMSETAIAVPDKGGVLRYDLIMTTNLIREQLQAGGEMRLGLLLRSTRFFSVTDPRDKVFAILGLHSTGFGIKLDYSKHASELFIEATKQIIMQEKTMNICGLILTRLEERKDSLPSWVPDYATIFPYQGTSLSMPQARYNAAAGVPALATWPFTRHPNILRTPTYLAETVTAVADEPPGRGIHRVLWWTRFANSSIGPRYVTGETALEAFWRTCVADASFAFYQQPAPRSYLSTLSGLTVAELTYMLIVADDNQRQILRSPLMRDLVQAISSSEDPSTTSHAAFTGLIDEVTLHFKLLTLGRRLFSTTSGYLCLAPASTRIGDEIHIVPGVKTPFILRLTKKGMMMAKYGDLDAYTMIGEAYVYGLMNGEALHRDGFEWKDILLK